MGNEEERFEQIKGHHKQTNSQIDIMIYCMINVDTDLVKNNDILKNDKIVINCNSSHAPKYWSICNSVLELTKI